MEHTSDSFNIVQVLFKCFLHILAIVEQKPSLDL